jgi:hypothetical protein
MLVRGVGLEVIAEKTEYMLLSCHKNKGKNHGIETANRFFENVTQFKYLGMTVTNRNFIRYKIKRVMNLANAHYHSV